MKKALVIRADASTQIGIGHVMRCLALAQAWQDNEGHAIFLMAEVTPSLEARLQSGGMEAIHLSAQPGSADDAVQTSELAQQIGATWVVVDGYRFGADYQRAIKDDNLCLLFIDDNGHSDHYYADIVLNQNIYAHEGLYLNKEPYTQLLLGSRYVLLRREFLKWHGWKRETPEVARKVLVTLGGGDPDNVTLKVIRVLNKVNIQDLEVKVIVGASNPNFESLKNAMLSACPVESQEAIHTGAPCSMHIIKNVENMPELMSWADVAVSAGGSTCWELAFMGLPNIALILAENQRSISELLSTRSVTINLGWHENLSSAYMAHSITHLLHAPETRAQMGRCAREHVDGEGARRVLMHIKGEMPRLRPVHKKDCRLLWQWTNDFHVRAASFSSEQILWEEHVKWFESKLNDPRCIFYISLNSKNVHIGQVRYDVEGTKAIVSLSIDRKYRGKGYGSIILWLSAQKLFNASDVRVIHAYVKQSNESSIRVFVKTGFKNIGKEQVLDYQATHLIFQKDELI